MPSNLSRRFGCLSLPQTPTHGTRPPCLLLHVSTLVAKGPIINSISSRRPRTVILFPFFSVVSKNSSDHCRDIWAPKVAGSETAYVGMLLQACASSVALLTCAPLTAFFNNVLSRSIIQFSFICLVLPSPCLVPSVSLQYLLQLSLPLSSSDSPYSCHFAVKSVCTTLTCNGKYWFLGIPQFPALSLGKWICSKLSVSFG